MKRFESASHGFSRRLSASVLSWTLLTTLGIGMVTLIPTTAVEAQEPMLRTLTVTGRGKETLPTTLAQVELGVEVQGSTAEAAQREAAQRSTAVVELLRSRQVGNLQTTGIRLSPQYDYQDGRAELVGYVATNTVSFRVKPDDVGPLLDDSVAAGATQINGIQFIAEDEAIADALQVALEEATADAQRQANTVLSTLNLGPQEIVNIQINGAQTPMPFPLPVQARVASAEADFSTPVIGGEQTVEASVTLQIRY